MNQNYSKWICCQIGAREHYAIPRALHQQGQLIYLITDAWISSHSKLNRLPKTVLAKLRERFHPDLAQASVQAFTNSLIPFEVAQKIKKETQWDLILARNHWFQQQAMQSLYAITYQLTAPPILFAYSYAALELFRYAKIKGWRTILGQIDPGIVEEKLVAEEHTKHLSYQSNCQLAPPNYWNSWQEECSLADQIIVNSPWSSQALQQVGIQKSKINIIPLVYQPPDLAHKFVRLYPSTFSKERPLRVLFLGQVILRKGIAALLEAAKLLRGQPIEFWLVGSQGIARPQPNHGEQVKWIGAVPRSAVVEYYQQADIFLFPTLSDGFGLTQLEAQAWKLPIIASKFCGEVVEDKFNGLILQEVTGKTIADVLQFCLHNPRKLETFSQQSTSTDNFSLLQLQHHLQSLSYAII